MKIARFAIVGVVATLVHAAVYAVVSASATLDPQFANVLGFVVAVFISYLGQRFWTFSHVKITREFTTSAKFLASSFLSLALNAIWVYLFTEQLALPPVYAIIGIVCFTPLVIFATLNFWVFR